jgi:hypothetical protein
VRTVVVYERPADLIRRLCQEPYSASAQCGPPARTAHQHSAPFAFVHDRSTDQQPADADGMPLELAPDPGVELLKLPDPVVLGIGAV